MLMLGRHLGQTRSRFDGYHQGYHQGLEDRHHQPRAGPLRQAVLQTGNSRSASAEMDRAQAIASAVIPEPFHHGKVKSAIPLTLP